MLSLILSTADKGSFELQVCMAGLGVRSTARMSAEVSQVVDAEYLGYLVVFKRFKEAPYSGSSTT